MKRSAPYKPRGRVAQLLAAMQAEPDRTWTLEEAAKVLKTTAGNVLDDVAYAIRRQAMRRGVLGGVVVLAVRPLAELGGEPAAAEWDPQQDVRVPQVDRSWRPPQMVAPRGGSR